MFLGLLVSGYGQVTNSNRVPGLSHLSLGTRFFLIQDDNPTQDYYRENLRRGYSDWNVNMSYGYSFLKWSKVDFQAKFIYQARGTEFIAYSQAPNLIGSQAQDFYNSKEDVDLRIKSHSFFLGFQGTYCVKSTFKWSHSVGLSVMSGRNHRNSTYHVNSGAYQNFLDEYHLDDTETYPTTTYDNEIVKYRVSEFRLMMDGALVFSSQFLLSDQLFLRFEQKFGTQRNFNTTGIENLSIYRNLFYFETSVGISLWKRRGARKLAWAEFKKQRKSKKND